MKEKITQTLIMVSKYTLIGIVMQAFCISMLMAYETSAQNNVSVKEITLSVQLKNATLSEAFNQIERQTNLKFNYHKSDLDSKFRINYSGVRISAEELLLYISKEAGLKFKQVNENVNVSKISNSNHETPLEILIQSKEITGKITSIEDGEGLPGVNIIEKGTNNGTVSDVNGAYKLVVSDDAVIVFSSVGFASEEVSVAGRSVVNMSMNPDVRQLQELVVVGYGLQKKSDVTGAVTSVGAEELSAMPVPNAIQGIQGRAAGVDVATSDRPGSVSSMLIRGRRSLTATSSPLYVVDGIPLAAGGIEALNPQDIESIDILKDASAAAIYGSKGANGVVLITTKKGNSGRVNLNLNSSVTFSRLHDRAEMMNAAEHIEFRREAYRTANLYPAQPSLTDDQTIFNATGDPTAWANIMKGWEGGTWDGMKVPTTDWGSMVIRTGVTQEHTLSVSGGSEEIQAYGSFGWLDQLGTNLGQDYERYSTKFGLDIQPTKWFKMGGNIIGSWAVQNYGYAGSGSRAANGIYAAANGMYPYALPYAKDGSWIYLPGGYTNVVNPVEEHKNVIDERKNLRVLGSFYSEINFFDGLKYRINFGPDFRQYRQGIFRSGASILQGTGNGKNMARAVPSQSFAYTLDNLLYYDKKFDIHSVGLTLLQSSSLNRFEEYSMETEGMEWDEQKWYNFGLNDLTRKGSNYRKVTGLSYMARVNYSLLDKYLLTASVRWDGASQLSEGNKWDVFPAMAVAWKMDEEDFMKTINWLDQLKLRIGFGTIGNSAIGAYDTQGAVAHVFYPFNENYGSGYYASDYLLANPPLMANQMLGWEKTTQTNIGIDFSLIAGRVSGTIDVYKSNTKDLLMEATIPALTGYTRTMANVGETSNRGIDITINSVNVSRDKVYWSTDLIFSRSKDKIESLTSGVDNDINMKWFVGQPIQVAYDYEKIGIWQTDESDVMAIFNENGNDYKAGDVKVRDQNGDNLIEPNEDRVVVGQYLPKWTGGLNNTFRYGDFELTAFIYARWGFIMDGGAADVQGIYQSRKIDYWTPGNPTNAYPRPDYNNGGQPLHYSAMNYQDGSFIKMRNLSFGYNLPASFGDRLGIGNAKVYVQAMDPFMIYSKCDFMDGDVRSSVSTRSLVVGLNIGF